MLPHLRRYALLICRIMIVLLLGGLFPTSHSTAKLRAAPVPNAPAGNAPSLASNQPALPLTRPADATTNPLTNAFINAIPLSDGASVLFSVTGVESTSNPLVVNIDPGTGPSGHQGSYTLTLSETKYLATAIGFTPTLDVGSDGDDTVSITTTIGSEPFSTGAITFQRAYVTPADDEDIFVDGEAFKVELLNSGTFAKDAYLMVMSTNASPGPLPNGYTFASKTYSLSPSGLLTQTEQLMNLVFSYSQPLPGGVDPHTLAVVRWNINDNVWEIMGGDLFGTAQVGLATQQFGIYALASIPRWHDGFGNSSGISAFDNARSLGGSIVLNSGATSGSVTSVPIAPGSDATTWGALHYQATIPAGAGLAVDLLSPDDQVVRTNLADGADLADLSTAAYPTLKLRARLTAPAGQSPALDEWQVGWRRTEQYQMFLPVALRP